ncbi:hypothetical protein MPTK1_6g18960 [Marchantia polymorpha subsp. ruderalis]|uniref:Uncharacterized protein n=2 Tax=Marchantia polymorpha TaxID=3197 RepID=A0AAF6BTM6_MARPO|nr:hypothetical protein MARPO_0038s0106 [Marchantia polymorpha]BBN15360.1 hypothetical protein Mp_6g18960 [Marchantia polymorpha subsp. ruderalis]|eukprot:PTQ40793.1 hypothetical protein MARPO_0038s0106 [Marchantia polymorpha]
MDPTSSIASKTEEEEWDADGFEIPSLNTGKPAAGRKEKSESDKSTRPSFEKVKTKPETIYLGPHGAPPKGQEATSPSNRKQRLKQKLKDAEKKGTPLGRENKVEVLRDLIGSKTGVSSPRAASEGWLEPFCHENQFERAKRPA